MLLETKTDGTQVYGLDYSGKYEIENDAPGSWNVYTVEDYSEISNYYEEMADEMGINLMCHNTAADKMRHAWEFELNRARLGQFKTRKAAREYVEQIGGTW